MWSSFQGEYPAPDEPMAADGYRVGAKMRMNLYVEFMNARQ
jgi:hypothetical protein